MKIHPCVWPPDQFEGLCQISIQKNCEMEKVKTALCDLTEKLLPFAAVLLKLIFLSNHRGKSTE